jgi:hypothetical protein
MYIGMGLIATITYRYLLKAENARRDRGERNEIIGGHEKEGNEKNGRYASVEEARRDKGDQWSGYRYII